MGSGPVFGGVGETIRVTHDTHSDSSYESGILLGLRAVRDARGVVVGLDKLLDLGLPGAATGPGTSAGEPPA